MPQGGGLHTGDRDSDPRISVYRGSRVACTAKRNANTPHVFISVDLRHQGGGDTDVAHCWIVPVVFIKPAQGCAVSDGLGLPAQTGHAQICSHACMASALD